MPQYIPYSRMTNTMIHFRDKCLANLKAQGLYDVADPDHDPESGDIYEQDLFKGKQSLYILFWLLPSKQKRGEN